MKETKKLILKVCLFIVCLVLTLTAVQSLFKVQDWRVRPLVVGLRQQPAGSLDCVCVGGSQTYAAWTAPFAYKETGITSWTYALPHAPSEAIINYIIEARKKQPNAVYVIAVNSFRKTGTPIEYMHHSADYMPFSLNKWNMIENMSNYTEMDFGEKMELVFPLIRFHSGWNQLESENFSQPIIDFKSAMSFSSFLRTSDDVSALYRQTDARKAFPDSIKNELDKLLKYLKKENVKATFVFYPQALGEKSSVAGNNAVCDYVSSQGFDVLDLMAESEELGIDFARDFYNYRHNNIHGSYKVTHRLAQHIKEKYGLSGKHSKKIEADWDECTDKYYRIARSYLYDFEFEHAKWDPEIGRPRSVNAIKSKDKITVSWQPAEKADGYLIYRKLNEEARSDMKTYNMTHMSSAELKMAICYTPWECLGKVKDVYTFTDTDRRALKNKGCKYSVVPYRKVNGETSYGSFKYLGFKVKKV